ncbi:hypothetical protein [Pseudanabaena sp. FACHB-2040]|uniref:hypothetical protein n=1 Tax=Pseudanabaena sp. FACHB-2040 TaxID=2692859 RepID=UPI00168328AE|nr:hypothetical protein [Pseudanabaena sp. FACHB-2040]MBD2259594.1 hypothetical protein [Pseudanabaena sp. FACHB-2040]
MTYTQPKSSSNRINTQSATNPLIQRLIQPQIVANWSIDENGQVVCLWESCPGKRPKSQ